MITGKTMYMIKTSIILLLTTLLSACLSFGPHNYQQTKMLKKEGFVLTEEGWSLGLPESLIFSFDHFIITAQQNQELTRLAQQLKSYKLEKLNIIGHTDDIGDPTYNLELSKNRASNVADIFLQQGFNPKNIQVIGRGSSQPLVPNNSNKNRAENRRVTIIIVP